MDEEGSELTKSDLLRILKVAKLISPPMVQQRRAKASSPSVPAPISVAQTSSSTPPLLHASDRFDLLHSLPPSLSFYSVCCRAVRLLVLLLALLVPGMVYEWMTTPSDPCAVRIDMKAAAGRVGSGGERARAPTSVVTMSGEDSDGERERERERGVKQGTALF